VSAEHDIDKQQDRQMIELRNELRVAMPGARSCSACRRRDLLLRPAQGVSLRGRLGKRSIKDCVYSPAQVVVRAQKR